MCTASETSLPATGPPYARAGWTHAVDVRDELGIDFHWDVRKLWSSDLPVVALDVVDLLWLLELPFWTNGDQHDIAPIEVARDRDRFPREFERTMRADLRYPINVIWLRNRWVVLDGLHRLLKAHLCAHSTIDAKTAHVCDLPLFRRTADEPSNHP